MFELAAAIDLFRYAAIVPVSATLYRWRGGGFFLLPGETEDSKRTQIRRLTWAIPMGLLTFNPWVFAVLMLSCFTGWGYAISVAIGAKDGPRESKFWPLDKLADLITKGDGERAYGVVWLTLHGVLFGTLASLATHSLFPVFLWSLMGVSFYYAKDWNRGEIFYGAIQGLGLALALMVP